MPNTDFIAFSILVQEAIFAPIFYSDDRGALHPGLAASIPTVANGGISRDGLTYTFRLRPGLLWSDGAPLDARDVDYSWRIWTDKKLIVNSTAGFDHIRSAQVSPDHLGITFHLTAPYAPFLAVWVDQVMPLARTCRPRPVMPSSSNWGSTSRCPSSTRGGCGAWRASTSAPPTPMGSP